MTSVKARIASNALGTPLSGGIWAHTARDFISAVFEIRSRPIYSSFTLASSSRSGKEEGDTQPGAMGAIGNGTTCMRQSAASFCTATLQARSSAAIELSSKSIGQRILRND